MTARLQQPAGYNSLKVLLLSEPIREYNHEQIQAHPLFVPDFHNDSVFVGCFWAVRALASDPSGPITIPDAGCPMAHCDPQMSDQINRPAPTQTVSIVYTDDLSIGSFTGLGCASNGEDTAACSFGRAPSLGCDPDVYSNTIAIYRIDGSGNITTSWRSGDLLNCAAFASAPIVAEDGTVIAADSQKILRVSPGNSYTFTSLLTEAMPISPIFIETETITQQLFVATKSLPDANWAPIYLYDVVSLTLLSHLNLIVEGDRFETRNTPGAYGNRFYVSASGIVDGTEGRLFAVDVLTDTTMQVAWGNEDYGESETSFIATPLTLTTLYTFTSPSGASPLVLSPVPPTYPYPIVLFDGGLEIGGDVVPHIIAVEDDPAGPEILWTRPMSGVMAASFALDLRDIGTGKDSLWTFTKKKPDDGTTQADHRFLYRFGIANGTMISGPLDLNARVIGPNEQGIYVPASAISMAGDENNPVLIISAVKFAFGEPVSTYLVAINLETSNLLWKVPMPYTNGQYPITVDSVNGELIFATTHGYEGGGIRVIGEEQ